MSVGSWDGAPEMEGALDSDGPCVGESVGFVVGCVVEYFRTGMGKGEGCELVLIVSMVA